jgi:hypothetical protein
VQTDITAEIIKKLMLKQLSPLGTMKQSKGC